VLDHPNFIEASEEGLEVRESDDLQDSSKGLSTGYAASKWSSEAIVRAAGRNQLCGCVIRAGYILGAATGVSNTDDFLLRYLKACVQVMERLRVVSLQS
jgi:L-2-aminoadipate reductase